MTINPNVLAETLFSELIERIHCGFPDRVVIPQEAVSNIAEKVRLYQFTCTLICVLSIAKTKPEFIPVQEHLEALFFATSHSQRMHVYSAMGDIYDLLTTDKKESWKGMEWAQNWLLAEGITENNPVTLDLFSWGWMDFYITITDALKDFDPKADVTT